jgi:hypothetical protein
MGIDVLKVLEMRIRPLSGNCVLYVEVMGRHENYSEYILKPLMTLKFLIKI